MKVFGMKQREPTDADRAAAARLSAVAGRFKGNQPTYLTESTPDPLGHLGATGEAATEPEAPEDSQDPDCAA
jgi:hypothetical protein